MLSPYSRGDGTLCGFLRPCVEEHGFLLLEKPLFSCDNPHVGVTCPRWMLFLDLTGGRFGRERCALAPGRNSPVSPLSDVVLGRFCCRVTTAGALRSAPFFSTLRKSFYNIGATLFFHYVEAFVGEAIGARVCFVGKIS